MATRKNDTKTTPYHLVFIPNSWPGVGPVGAQGCIFWTHDEAGASLRLRFNVLPVPFYAVDTSRASARVAGARGNIYALA